MLMTVTCTLRAVMMISVKCNTDDEEVTDGDAMATALKMMTIQMMMMMLMLTSIRGSCS